MVVKDASAIDEAIVEAIIYDVMQQHLGPGTRLSEKSVCDRFGVSRMNVRRALLTLSNIGVVELQANKGARIRQPTLQQAMTLFETRRTIESIIIKSVVAQRSDADIVSLNAHVELEEQAFSNNDRHQLIRLSGEFHLLIASFQNNHLLTGFMQTLITESSLIISEKLTISLSTPCSFEYIKIRLCCPFADLKIVFELKLIIFLMLPFKNKNSRNFFAPSAVTK
jgi:DNA-binding GntR family transcriptional regulator